MKVLDFISIVPWTIVAQICNLLILTLLVKKFLFKPVMAVLDKRQQEIDATYESADIAKIQASELKEDYENRLKNAKEEASDIVKNATVRATERGNEIIGEATKNASILTQRAEENIAQEKKKAMEEMKNEIGNMAVSIASEVISREVKESDHDQLIDSFIKNVGDVS